MLRVIVLSLLIATPALGDVPPPPLPPLGYASPSAAMEVITFGPPPREAACEGGRTVRVIEAAPLHPRLVAPLPTPAPDGSPFADSDALPLTFAVDAGGRPIGIRRAQAGRLAAPSDAALAALASWRFASDEPATGCKIAFAPHRTPIAQASRASLFEILAFERRNAPSLVRETVSKAGDCGTAPRRSPKTIAFPDLRRFDGRDLNPGWAAVTYDVDAGGTPRNVRVETQGGDPALADLAAAAIAESRFQTGRPVQACYGVFAAAPRETPAPPRPDLAGFKRPDDNCEVAREALNLPPVKNYPRAYADRKVAGWAYLRFDVAPWGQIGNIQVVASEPSAAFGDAAQSMLWSARPKAPPEGYRGCLVPVIYAIPDPEPIVD
jgi:TonB family protein